MSLALSPDKNSDLSFKHLHHLEDEAAGRTKESEAASAESRRHFGRLDQDLGTESANACVLGVEVVHFINGMGEAGPDAPGDKVLEYDRLKEQHPNAAEDEDRVFSFAPTSGTRSRSTSLAPTSLRKATSRSRSITFRPTFQSSLIMTFSPVVKNSQSLL
jgi:hypothetical protein